MQDRRDADGFADFAQARPHFVQAGFSFTEDGPLDMRLDPSLSTRAADLVNGLKETGLADLIFRFGEEHRSRKIAHLICQARRHQRLDSTRQLAQIICQALGIDPGRISPSRKHPATRTFQALRIAVNDELTQLERLLDHAPACLAPGGVFAVISFHSLEDALVKRNFRQNAQNHIYSILTKKPIVPGQSEILRNPRARSAKLRAVEKTA
ncbi:MAG: 16S rRNA (cytosine(1402)-N(4))-methyltransferase RsmH [Anaerolineales bacterium]